MKSSLFRFSRIVLALLFTAGLFWGSGHNALAAGTISITDPTGVYTQNFDTLVSVGSSSSMPNGWYLAENGTYADGNYTASDGNLIGANGDTFSFGAASSQDRAFGSYHSTGGTLLSTIGANFANDTGSTIDEIAISYTGEEWFRGGSGNTDSYVFAYSLDATDLKTGTWTTVSTLTFNSPNTSGAASALNGNDPANQTAISSTITGLNIPDGSSFWIKWTDTNIPGNDDGLAVDNLSLSLHVTDLAPSVTEVVPANGATDAVTDANLSVTFSEPVDVTGTWFTINCDNSGAHTGTASGGPVTFAIDPDVNFNLGESCSATIFAAQVTDQDGIAPANMLVDYQWSFQIANDIPVADSQSVSTNEDTDLPITLTASDVYPGPLTWTVDTGPTHGSLTGSAPDLTYSPDANFNGDDSFTFHVNDTFVDSNTATVSIHVNPVNDTPVLGTIENQTIAEGSLLSFQATAEAIDLPPDTLTFSLVNAPTGAQIEPATGVFTWTPTEIQGAGSYTFTVKVCDNGTPSLCDQQDVTVTVDEVPTNPVAGDDSYHVNEGQVLNVAAPGVLDNDSDADLPSQTLTAVKVTDPAHGVLSLNGDGSFTYTPNTHWTGTDSFTYMANDGALDSSAATVSIVVHPVNHDPVLDLITSPLTVAEGSEASFTAAASDPDLPGDILTFSLVGAPTGAQIDGGSGGFAWTPSEAQGPGSYTFTVKVCDNGMPSLCDQQDVTISVDEVPSNPVAGDDAYDVVENQVLSVLAAGGVLSNDSDADLPAQTLTVSKVADPAHGTLVLTSNGSFTYTPQTNWFGTDSFTYVVSDGALNSNIATVTITVTPLPRIFIPLVHK